MIEIPPSARVYVAGHRGLVGSSILRRLRAEGFENLLTATRDELDLRDQAAVNALVPGATARSTSSWSPARSAASSPTPRARPSSSTTT